MALSLAGIELGAVSLVRASEDRHVVRHHLPGFEGDVLQDLGRGPSVFTVAGVLHGDQASADADSLRAAFRGGEPVELAAALATTLEVQDVLIRSLELQEQAGWPSLIEVRATVVEYIEPPSPSALGTGALGGFGALDGGALGGAADAWSAGLGEGLSVESLSRQIINDPGGAGGLLGQAGGLRADVLADVGSRLAGDTDALGGFLGSLPGGNEDLLGAIGGALSGDPAALQAALVAVPGGDLGGVLGSIAAGDIAGALTAAADDIGAGQMGSLLRTLGSDPSKLGEIITTALDDPAAAAAMVAGALDAPGVLGSVLRAAPGFIANLDPDDLAGSIAAGLKDMAQGELGDALSAVTGLDVGKAAELIESLADADSLQDVAKVLAEEGLDFLEDATGLELRKISTIANGLYNSGDFLQRVKRIIATGRTLFQQLKDLDPVAELERIRERMP
ncbi:DNA circularization N-terminal domain-containing protein [Haliangium sp.]|uniref:DNA circularization N-terminal domain-containing protein n=1 Tax=Haliangium sp. TaxID=2663208 RepID=UPI003D0C6D2A